MKLIRYWKRSYKALGILILLALAFGAGFWFNGRLRNPDEKLIEAAFRVISNDAIYNQQSDQELSYAAVRGMLATIDDPYAELIEPEAAQNFNTTFTGQTGVVGLYAENKSGQVVISIVFPGGPAEQAGLQVGDVILAIDDVDLDKDSELVGNRFDDPRFARQYGPS